MNTAKHRKIQTIRELIASPEHFPSYYMFENGRYFRFNLSMKAWEPLAQFTPGRKDWIFCYDDQTPAGSDCITFTIPGAGTMVKYYHRCGCPQEEINRRLAELSPIRNFADEMMQIVLTEY